MIVKIILMVSLLKICSGDDPTNEQSHTKQAISSQSFVRHDVPLSYKYSAVHIYTTPKPNQNRHEQFSNLYQSQKQPPKEIQYAPIYNTQHDFNSAYGSNHNANEFTPDKSNYDNSITKGISEPKPQDLQNLGHKSDHLRYLPGNNVEVLQTVNTHPVHNTVYRSYPNMAHSEKISKENFLNQYVLYQKPQEYVTPSQIVRDFAQTKAATAKQLQATFASFVPKQQHYQHQQRQAPSKDSLAQKPQPYNAAHVATLNAASSPLDIFQLQELISHPKAHRMLLNVPRIYNIAHNPHKAQHVSFILPKNKPAYT